MQSGDFSQRLHAAAAADVVVVVVAVVAVAVVAVAVDVAVVVVVVVVGERQTGSGSMAGSTADTSACTAATLQHRTLAWQAPLLSVQQS